MQCPFCRSHNTPHEAYLGLMGWKVYYRCRYCGWTWADLDGDNPHGNKRKEEPCKPQP